MKYLSPRLSSLLLLCLFLGIPSALYAQASIAGIVKDSSGAVLPGVTVEAASPALIEKVRSVVTDGSGQYKIELLRPGTYSVTFTLTGFSVVKREGIELTGSFVATVNADLKVGSVEESITVTSETPVVDLQSTVQQRTLTTEVVDTLPTGKSTYALAALIPGAVVPIGFVGLGQDVGGSTGDTMQTMIVHGSASGDQRMTVDGLPPAISEGSGQFQAFVPNTAVIQETTVDTSAVSGELPGGGIRLGIVPRDGGNKFSGNGFGSFVTPGMVGSNLTARVQALGLTAANTVDYTYDVNAGFGGPLVKDKLWFFTGVRMNSAQQFIAGPGAFYNANAGNPNAWTYAPIPGDSAIFRNPQNSKDLRLTWQVNSKNKITAFYSHQVRCYCPRQSSTAAPEAATVYNWPHTGFQDLIWSSPLTSRLLVEAGIGHMPDHWQQGIPSEDFSAAHDWAEVYNVARVLVPVVEQSTGVTYRNMPGSSWYSESWTTPTRASISYVTGSHAVKVGFNDSQVQRDRTLNPSNPQDISFRFNNSLPNQITENANPLYIPERSNDLGIYAQDKWTLRRLTMSYGVRFDYFHDWFPASHLGPGANVPNRNIDFAELQWVSWKDFTPRFGVAYDLRGDGKTALKFTANKYMISQGLQGAYGDSSSPVNQLANTVTRSWNDVTGTFRPAADGCDLLNPNVQIGLGTAAKPACGAVSDLNFGTPTKSLQVDPAIILGSGVRPYNWEFGGSVQQQLAPRVSVTASYYRRIYGNFNVTDNLAVSASDFSPFQIRAPIDPGLPNGGGYTVTGLYDVNPNKTGQVNNYFTAASHYGNQYQHWNGFDFSINMRLPQGILLEGGTDTGRTFTDNCQVLAVLPEISPLATSQPYCHVNTPFQTQIKVLGSYVVPKIGVNVAATFQSLPGPQVTANDVIANAFIVPSLGRSLSGNAANATINIVAPGALYGDRFNQVDLRLGKIVRTGPLRVNVNFDVYNLGNSDAVLVEATTYALYRQPTQILQARYVKLSTSITF